jgi:hypothetical protein
MVEGLEAGLGFEALRVLGFRVGGLVDWRVGRHT